MKLQNNSFSPPYVAGVYGYGWMVGDFFMVEYADKKFELDEILVGVKVGTDAYILIESFSHREKRIFDKCMLASVSMVLTLIEQTRKETE